mgnify:CR=1 FL=1
MHPVAEATIQKPASPLRVRNFRLLWIGEGISLLGDQFYLIALPWLVLQLTGSALALGGIMAIASIPRAVFMLIGGAFVDRYSPRSVVVWIKPSQTLLYFPTCNLQPAQFEIAGRAVPTDIACSVASPCRRPAQCARRGRGTARGGQLDRRRS